MGRITGNKKGQPRKKSADKEKTGSLNTTREREYANREMKVVVMEEMPPAPDSLGEVGLKHWERSVRELHKNGILAACDLGLLEALCLEWELYIETTLLLKKHKGHYSIPGPDGKPRTWAQHPVQYNRADHLAKYLSLCNAFGFSPDARARIGVAAKDTATSKAAAMLKKAV